MSGSDYEGSSELGSSGGNSSRHRLSLTKRIKDGLFGVLFVMGKECSTSLWLVILGLVIDFLQVLDFPFNHRQNFPWRMGSMVWFSDITKGVVLEAWIVGNNVIFYITLVLVGTILLDVMFVSYLFSRGRIKMLWTLKFLRLTGEFVTTVRCTVMEYLVVPTVAAPLQPLN
eukprot:Opistho-2@76598